MASARRIVNARRRRFDTACRLPRAGVSIIAPQ
jgi:hypothetical protein